MKIVEWFSSLFEQMNENSMSSITNGSGLNCQRAYRLAEFSHEYVKVSSPDTYATALKYMDVMNGPLSSAWQKCEPAYKALAVVGVGLTVMWWLFALIDKLTKDQLTQHMLVRSAIEFITAMVFIIEGFNLFTGLNQVGYGISKMALNGFTNPDQSNEKIVLYSNIGAKYGSGNDYEYSTLKSYKRKATGKERKDGKYPEYPLLVNRNKNGDSVGVGFLRLNNDLLKQEFNGYGWSNLVEIGDKSIIDNKHMRDYTSPDKTGIQSGLLKKEIKSEILENNSAAQSKVTATYASAPFSIGDIKDKTKSLKAGGTAYAFLNAISIAFLAGRTIQLLLYTIFAPIAISDFFSSGGIMSSPAVRFMKKYLGVVLQGGVLVLILVISQMASSSIMEAASGTGDALVARFILPITTIGLMAKSSQLTSDVFGI